jgi:hypothetical protein
MRHKSVNDLIKRALASANVPSMLEPSSLSREDGKRPDGLTILPWANGCCLIGYSTHPDAIAASHLDRVVLAPGTVANDAEQRKRRKYFPLAAHYHFVLVAIETLELLGDEAMQFLRIFGRRVAAETGEPRSLQFLLQRVSLAEQCGFAACITGTIRKDCTWDNISYL